MFGIGFFELLLIAVIALLFVGPKKLPELAKQIGKFYVQARRAATDVRGLVDDVVHQAEREIKDVEHNRIKQLLLSPPGASSGVSNSTKDDDRSGSIVENIDHVPKKSEPILSEPRPRPSDIS